MKRIIVLIVAGLLSVPTLMQGQSQAFNTAKSIDMFHSILRELSLYYVDSVKVDDLVYTGINAMLASMDPYTEFIPEEENESLEIMTTGSYGGVGALIKKRPGEGVLISEPYANAPITKAGLVAGDMILEIDGQSVLDWTADACSAKMKGVAGTQVAFLVQKLRGKDTVLYHVTREKVHLSDVALATVLQDSIAYIRVTGFTQGGAQDVRNALQTLQQQHSIKGIIIDLRSNGGGLMDEAIKMLSIFLPKHTMVVSAKGRLERFNVAYYTKDEPLDTTTPLILMVNQSSASSSEIVAGAIQDLKRGILVGKRTYGKGLVQTIRPLNYNASLKLTTAKYYIPSGRCVQAIDYSNRNEDGSLDKDEEGGIMPDVEATAPNYSRIALEMVARDYIHEYSLHYFATHTSIAAPEQFALTPEEYEEFVQITAAKEFDDRSATEITLDQFKQIAEAEGYDESLASEIASLQERLKANKVDDLRHYESELKPLLEEEICCRYYFQEGRIKSIIRDDPQLKVALSHI